MSNEPYPNPNAPYGLPPTAPGIAVQQPGAPFAPGASGGERKKGLVVAGVVLLLAGVGGGIAAYIGSGSAYDDGVDNLARAPVGCTTRLDFDKAGTFTIYIETEGVTDDPGGDCPNSNEEYERASSDLPDVDLALVNDDDEPVDLASAEGKSYDAGGAKGVSFKTVEIDKPGRYELTVTSDDDDFAMAVGKNPKEAADSLKTISYVLIAAGVVLGAVLIILGRRRKPAAGGGAAAAPATYYPQQQPPAAYPASGAYTPAAPPPLGGGFAPPAPAPPTPAPRWPAPPST